MPFPALQYKRVVYRGHCTRRWTVCLLLPSSSPLLLSSSPPLLPSSSSLRHTVRVSRYEHTAVLDSMHIVYYYQDLPVLDLYCAHVLVLFI